MTVLQTEWLFPVDDVVTEYNDSEVSDVMCVTQLDKVVPKPNVDLGDLQSDEALTRIAFYDLGAHRVEACAAKEMQEVPNAVYKVDLMFLCTVAVRPGFEPYGVTAYFGVDTKPLAIRDHTGTLVFPAGGAKWEHAKFAWRVSLLTVVTAVDHLFNLHFGVAAMGLMSVVEGLSLEHPVRRAVHPFFMRTALVNNKAGSALLPQGSIIHHLTAFPYESLVKIAENTYKKGDEWRPLPQRPAQKGIAKLVHDGKLPYYEDGIQLFNIFKKYFEAAIHEACVKSQHAEKYKEELKKFYEALRRNTASSFIPELYSHNGMADVLGQLAFVVTAHHEQVGTVSGHLLTPATGGFRIRPGSTRMDGQSFLLGQALIGMTFLRTPPLLSDFDGFWHDDTEKQRWQQMQGHLRQLVKDIDSRNQAYRRQFPCVTCNPSVLECAVSI